GADAAEILEAVAQLQPLRFRIAHRALPAHPEPGGADFQAPVGTVDVEKAGRADDLAAGALDGCERDDESLRLSVERGLDKRPHIVGRLDGIREPAENLLAEADGDERVEVSRLHGLEPHVTARECHRSGVDHRATMPDAVSMCERRIRDAFPRSCAHTFRGRCSAHPLVRPSNWSHRTYVLNAS